MSIVFFRNPTIMFEKDGVFRFGREPVLRRMPDGSLFSLVYTGGDREPDERNVCAAIRSMDDGATWTKPEVLFSHRRRAVWGTELFRAGERTLLFFHTFLCETNYAEIRCFVTETSDNGRSWSDPRSVPGVPSNFVIRQGKILSDGSWIFPVYWMEQRALWDCQAHEGKERWFFVSGAIRSTDGGKHFSLHGCHELDGRNVWEPEITEMENGHLRMYFRVGAPDWILYSADSFDCGVTWTKIVPTEISSAGSKMVICDLPGCKVMINNACVGVPVRRDRLELAVSTDRGATWHRKLMLAELSEDDALVQVAYPHVFADDAQSQLYAAIDGIDKFFLMKIPYSDII